MTIVVQSPGMQTTVQDLGRPGYGALGVSASGAADPVALRVGNRIVGNREGAPALELTMLGGTFVFPEGATIAIAGGDFGASVPMWSAVEIEPGRIVRLGPSRSGARAYLCVRGGIDVPRVMGSASTHVLTGLGGFEGRALRRGDVLAVGSETEGSVRKPRPECLAELFAPRNVLRVTAGPQFGDFTAEALSGVYSVSEQSNRMGIRLTGPTIDTPHRGGMITEGVALGAVQVPAGGQPIVLFVEQQTTGGYPKIANVITADLPVLGRLRPRDQIRFELVDLAEARRLLRLQEDLLTAPETWI